MFDIFGKRKMQVEINLLSERLESLNQKLRQLETDVISTRKSIAKKANNDKKKEEHVKALSANLPKIVERTGWDVCYAEQCYNRAYKLTGCTPKEYYMYRFYELNDAEQKKMFLIAMQKKLRKKYDASAEFVKIICNKELTNQYFSDCVKRPWCVNTKADFNQFKKLFCQSERIIYKPIAGHRGYGIEAFEIKNESELLEIYNRLKDYPEGVVEEFVKQHAIMSKLSPDSVNSVRFVTISSNKAPVTEDGKMIDIAYSIVRIGRKGSIVDNLHSGGMVANVDIETGKLATNGADRNGSVFEVHPETGAIIKGFEIPYFDEAKEMVLNTIIDKKVEGYLGWDIAISETGPMLLEVNTCPGADGLQTAYAQEGKGMKHIMDKYLWDDIK